ncbi:siderophore-interacting protein [Nocardia carnea]|uniref:siderophore-interacting protein n=1 Tax=Nocardia carnea TaxID=37328 RepID=UPI00245676BC|nr:siderophore-interacting protein [Nocardia carnea]
MSTPTVAAPATTYAVLRVCRTARLTPDMVRITLTATDPAALTDAGADQFAKLFFPLPGQDRPAVPPPVDETAGVMSWYRQYLAMPDEIRPPMRTYTIRALRPALGELDIDFVLHPDAAGPASGWAAAAAPGHEIGLLCPPRALYRPPHEAAWQLLVGDETAIPAIGAIIERLAPDTVLRAYIEVAGRDHEHDFTTRGHSRVVWVPRGTRRRGDAVLEAVRAAEFPEGAAYAWISGEAGLVKSVRRHLVRDRGIDKHAVTFTGYWRQGHSEEDTGREKVRRADTGEPLRDDD